MAGNGHAVERAEVNVDQLSGAALAYRLGAAAGVTLAFTGVARLLRSVNASGAVAGAAVSFVLYASAGPAGFAALASVFLLTVISTHIGYSRKQRLGTAEKDDGRTASQVLANLGVAAVACTLFAFRGHTFFLLAAAAALAEAAADTVSSEYGQAKSDQARLITTGEIVPAGTDGGITAAGIVAGTLAGLIVSAVCASVRLIPWAWVGFAGSAAAIGMLLDSLLGATLQRRRLLDNNKVNFLSTLMAAVIALLLVQIWR